MADFGKTCRVSIVAALLVAASAAAVCAADAPLFPGRFVGYGFIADAAGTPLRTEVRMDIRANEDGSLRVELNYLDNQIAKFASAKLQGEYALRVDEDVKTDAEAARASGYLHTRDGTRIAGTISVRRGAAGDGKAPVRTIKILVDRLKEYPGAGSAPKGATP